MILLISHVEHAHWLSEVRCGWMDVAHAGFTSHLLVRNNPAVRYVKASVVIEVQALWCHCMQIASYMTDFII